MSNSSSAADTFNAIEAAHTAAHALKTQLDGYATGLAAEGAPEAASVCAEMSDAISSSLDKLDVVFATLSDNNTQNS